MSNTLKSDSASDLHQLCLDFAKWKKDEKLEDPERIIFFRKGEDELLIHEYRPNRCAALQLALVSPRILGFRPWHEPVRVVIQRVQEEGWQKIREFIPGEVHHAPSH